MRIGVLSDTHVQELSNKLLKTLEGLNLDLIVHCGDFTGKKVIDQLTKIGKFIGVAGNMDPPEIHRILKKKEIIEIEGKRIGIFHGYGLFTDERLVTKFKGEKIDLFLYGHTHQLRKETKEGVHYLNPGAWGKSMIIVTIEKDKDINARIIGF